MNQSDFIRYAIVMLKITSESNVLWQEIVPHLDDEDIYNLKNKIDTEIADRTVKQQPTKQWGFIHERAN